MLSSDIIHCTAPSPTVYPEVLLFEQRQSKVGVLVQTLVGKFDSRKDSKHSCAQAGTKFVSSAERVIAVWAGVEYNRRRNRLGQHNAILEAINAEYQRCSCDHCHGWCSSFAEH